MMSKIYKTRDVIQDEAAECGLACISYISGMLGQKISLEKLRRLYDVNMDGLSFYHLMKICSAHNMIATGVTLTVDSLSELKKPAVLLWNNCHFVVLKKVSKKKIEVMDPAVGSRFFSLEEARQFFSGMALEIHIAEDSLLSGKTEPQDDDATQKNNNFFSMKSFSRGLFRYRDYMLPLALMAIIIQLTNVAIPKFMSLVFDEVLPKNDEDFLFLLIYIFAFVYFLQSIGSYLKIVLAQRLRRSISQSEGLNTMKKLLQMDLKYFNKRMPSDLLRKIKSVDVLHVIFTHGWVDIIVDAFFAVIFVVLLFMISFELTILTLTVTGLMVLVRVLLLPRLMSHQYSAIDGEVKRDNTLLQAVDNISMIKINHSEYRKINNWFYHHAELEANRSSIEKINAVIQLSVTTISHIQTLIIMGVGAYSVLKGENTAGQLISFIFYKNCLMNNIQALVENQVNLKICSVEVRRLQDIIPEQQEEEVSFSLSGLKTHEKIESVEVQDLGFSYMSLDAPFIRQINFTIAQQDKLVLTGPSGCGKTTVLNLLAGLLTPSVGEILINGIPLRRFGYRQYQSQIAMVSATDNIIDGSVLDNIIYECDYQDMLLLEQCIDKANLAEVIRSLSAGLNTRLGTNGAKLSSGQQQRLMIARALYRRPALMLLDEPTSHLDEDARRAITQLIMELPLPCLIVSHDRELIDAIGNKIAMQAGGE